MKRMRRNKSYQMNMMAIAVAAVILMAGCASAPAPLEQMTASGNAINAASIAGGEKFAPLLLRSAMDKLYDAGHAMEEKDYVHARRLAEEAQVFARMAEAKANSGKAQQLVYDQQDASHVPVVD